MDQIRYRNLIDAIPFGKRLPTAHYVHRHAAAFALPTELKDLLSTIEKRFEVGDDFNVLKLKLDELKLSYLCYPDFFEVAHPELRQVVTIDLVRGRARRVDYSGNRNAPILHRKEAFLPADHEFVSIFHGLTIAEEQAGLYAEPRSIGFQRNWERLLRTKSLRIEGHCLKEVDSEHSRSSEPHVQIERHKTAIHRTELSKPLKCAIELGLLRPQDTVFDYGCGLGTDVAGLTALGYTAVGWDPAHCPAAEKCPADVVNLGYVLNVIEDPAERLETLRAAYTYSARVLVVAALVRCTAPANEQALPFLDGILTQRNTFQKFFEQQELQEFLEDALDTTAVPLSLGVFCVFRRATDLQTFLSSRTRRVIDWTRIKPMLGLRRSVRRDIFEENKDVLERLLRRLLELGRLPITGEFSEAPALRAALGSLRRAYRIIIDKFGTENLDQAREARSGDLLVYLALSNLRKPVPSRHLSESLKADVRTFFGTYQTALARSRDILFAAGDPDEIELACEDVHIGWQDESSLIIHRSLLPELPPILRIYVHCAAHRYGDPALADLIKIHKRSGKITFQHYDDFDGKTLPELKTRIKVNLRSLFVEVFDYSAGPDFQLLYFKERFVRADYPGREVMSKFSEKLRKAGFAEETIGFGPTKAEFQKHVRALGLNENLIYVDPGCRRRQSKSRKYSHENGRGWK